MFLRSPAPIGSPSMWMLGIDGAGGIEIAVGLLSSCHHIEHGVDVLFEESGVKESGVSRFLLSPVSCLLNTQNVACAFYGFVYIGIVEREAHELGNVPFRCLQARMTRVLKGIGSHFEVLIAVLTLAFRESQRDGHLASCLDTIAPESVGCNLYGGKRNLGIGIPALGKGGAHTKKLKIDN